MPKKGLTKTKPPRQQGKKWNKDEVLNTLKPYFRLGYNVSKACRCAGIAESTVKHWIQKSEMLRLKVNAWQNEVSAQARANIIHAIKPKKDDEGNTIPGSAEQSRWWLERREKDDFSIRNEHTGAEGGPIVHVDAGRNPYADDSTE
jgi:transposase-like protein